MTNGFTFDGIHSDIVGLIVNSKLIPATPTITNRLQEIGGVDGSWDYGINYGPREIEIEVTIIGDTPSETKQSVRKLIGVMNPKKGPRPLVFDDEPEIMYFARISNQVPLTTLGALGTFTLQLTCPDPFAYSANEKSFSFVGNTSVSTTGTEEAKPILVVDHGGGSGKITLNRPDGIEQIVTFKSNSPAGMYSIDSKAKTARIGGNRAYNYVSGDYLSLAGGQNVMVTSGNIKRVTGTYRETWI